MSDIEYLPHLWIPDEEVEPIEKTPRGFSEDRGWISVYMVPHYLPVYRALWKHTVTLSLTR